MKTMLYVFAGFSLILFSCERKTADQSSKVIISTPSGDNSLQNILDPLSVSSSPSSSESDFEDYNNVILPSFDATDNFPVNCYLIAVGSAAGEAAFTTNYCGKRSTVSGRIDAEYKFGPYVGLVPSGSSVEIEVPAGERRVVYVFAIHAANPSACKTLTSGVGDNPAKENFSRPYFVGSSATFTVSPGQTSIVPVNMVQPVVGSYIDDCVIPAAGSQQDALANVIAIEKNTFPKDILVSLRTGESGFPTGFRCDYVDIVPKFEYTENGMTYRKAARFNIQKDFFFKLDQSGSVTTTFPSKSDCENGINGVTQFPIQPLDTIVRRWIPLTGTMDGNNPVSLVGSTDTTVPSITKNFKIKSGDPGTGSLSSGGGTKYYRGAFDVSIPGNIAADHCYPIIVSRKGLEDEPVTAAINNSFDINVTPPGAVSFYDSPSCTGVVSTTELSAGNTFQMKYFKATQDFNLQITEGVDILTPVVEQSSIFTVKVKNLSSTSDFQPESVQITAADVIKARNIFKCNPILFRFVNKDGVAVLNQAPGSIEILFNQMEGDFSNLDFYDDPDCSTRQIVSGTSPIVTVPPGAQFHKIYMRTLSGATNGKKVVRFKVSDGAKTYFPKYGFEVIQPNN